MIENDPTDANDWLESTFNERKNLLDLAPKIFDLLYKFFEADLREDNECIRSWVIKKYWEIVKKRMEGFAVEINEAKQDGNGYSEEEEFEALKDSATNCLIRNYGGDVRDIWMRLDGENQ